MNTPDYFLIYDEVSFRDLFQEWVPTKDTDKLKMHRFERDSDEIFSNLTTSVESLQKRITPDHIENYYYLAHPYIEENDFVMSGFVKTPEQDDPNDIEFGFRKDHIIPFTDDIVVETFKTSRGEPIVNDNVWFQDIRRIALGFPYQSTKLTFSVTNSRVGRNNTYLCFWDYTVDESVIRD